MKFGLNLFNYFYSLGTDWVFENNVKIIINFLSINNNNRLNNNPQLPWLSGYKILAI